MSMESILFISNAIELKENLLVIKNSLNDDSQRLGIKNAQHFLLCVRSHLEYAAVVWRCSYQ